MRVCHIYHGAYPGNVPFYVHTQKLAALGCDVTAVALRRPGEPAIERVGEVSVRRVADLATVNHRVSTLRFATATRDYLQTSAWDVVNVYNLGGSCVLPLTLRRSAHVWVMDVRSPPLHDRWRATLSNWRNRLEASAFNWVLVHAESVARAIFGSAPRNVSILPIGVDCEHFSPGTNEALRGELGIDANEFTLIYIGNLRPERRLARMLMGFVLANKALGNLHLLVVGEGSDANSLRALADEAGVGDRVHLVGFVPYTHIPDYLRAADASLAYVPITPWFDEAPVLKTLESLACGLPTVATATRGNQTYITHRVSGLLIDDSPTAVADGIIELCRNEALRSLLRAGRESVRQYDWTDIVRNRLLPVYQRLLDTR